MRINLIPNPNYDKFKVKRIDKVNRTELRPKKNRDQQNEEKNQDHNNTFSNVLKEKKEKQKQQPKVFCKKKPY